MSTGRFVELVSRSPDQTLAIGRALVDLVCAGEVLALSGALGAGKTQFVKGLALGLGVAEDAPVVSPTFVIVREYAGRLRLVHCDAYRLTSIEELLDLGLEEALQDGLSVVAIEWSDRFPEAFLAPTWRVEAEHAGPTARILRIAPPDPSRAGELGRLTMLD